MCFFENDYFLNILKSFKDKTFPMLVPTIVKLSENHWHKILQESLVALKTILKEIDSFTFEEAVKSGASDPEYQIQQSDEIRSKLNKKWDKLDKKLGHKAPLLPFNSGKLAMDYNALYKKVYDKEKFINQ